MPAVLCDVDGTLVDTNFVHTVCWWQALAEAGHHVPMVRIRAAIGMGSDRLVPHLLATSPDPSAVSRLDDRHAELFRPYWSRLQPTEGAAELLRACAARGLRVVLASSAGADELAALRGAIGADDAIYGSTNADQVATSKPAPDLIHRALQTAGVDREDAVLVGDAVWDVLAAAEAGIDCVALTCGGTPEGELRDAGAVAVYPDPAGLLAELAASPLARLG
jgi:HAD superfamily hydrolase (TIGR01509 family)